MKFKTAKVELEIKGSHDGRTISGYASTFGPPADVVGDVVDVGAFKKSIKENGPPKSTKIKLLWMHRDPLGMPTLLKEDDKGLFFEAHISKTRLGDEALELIRDRVVDQMSIGYRTVKEVKNPQTNANHLKEVHLFEISPVPFGANDRTSIDGVKTGGYDVDEIVRAVVTTLGLKRDPETGLILPPAPDDGKLDDPSRERITVSKSLAEALGQLSAAGVTIKQALDTIATSIKSLDDENPEPPQGTRDDSTTEPTTGEGETEEEGKKDADENLEKALEELSAKLETMTQNLKGLN